MANSKFAMAVHILVSLGLKDTDPDQGFVSSGYLADSVNTNPVVIRRILSRLLAAGIIETQEGKQGGARLAKTASSVNLHDVYLAVDDGQVFEFNPNKPKKSCPVSCKMKAVLSPIFNDVSQSLAKDLSAIKLSALIQKITKD